MGRPCVLVIERSSLMAVIAVATSLLGWGSALAGVAVTVAVLVIVLAQGAVAGAVEFTVKLRESFLMRVAIGQVTPPAVTVQGGEVAGVPSPAGIGSLSVTPQAMSGPRLVTVRT